MRPVSVCQGFRCSTLIENAVYRRPPCSDPDHSGEVMTLTGRDDTSAKVMRDPAWSSASCAMRCPVFRSSCWKPCTESRPLVVPDSARIISHARTSVSSLVAPAVGPPATVPLRRARSASSGSGWNVMPFVAMPSCSVSGPSDARRAAVAG